MLLQDPYELYKKYIAIRVHFTTLQYDYVTYNFQTKCILSEEKFKQLKTFQLFVKVATFLSKKETEGFLVSNYVEMLNFSISDAIKKSNNCIQNYKNWLKRNENLEELYFSDLRTIAKKTDGDWRKAVVPQSENDYPLLFKLVCSDQISAETFALLENLFDFRNSKLFKELKTDRLYSGLVLKYHKYRTLINITDEQLVSVTPKDLKKMLD